MKKIITLALAAGMMAAAAAPASAADIKMDGYWGMEFGQFSTSYAKDATKQDNAFGRFELGMAATASENLSGYVRVRYEWDWGKDNGGAENRFGDMGKDSPWVRLAYIDWMVPQTTVKVRMGRQMIALPAMAVNKNVALWNGQPTDGITVSSPVTDWLNVSGFWGRYARTTGTDTCRNENLDVFGLVAQAKFDGFSVAPYVVYAAGGETKDHGNHFGTNNQGVVYSNVVLDDDGNIDVAKSSVAGSNTIIAGVNAALTLFDPLTVKADFVYGDRNYKGNNPAQHGWFVDASVAYKTAYGTPSLTAYYGSGDDKDVEYRGQEQLPSIDARNGFTRHYFNGSMLDSTQYNNRHSLAGTWGVKLAMDGISFMEDLTHSVAVAYVQGTNAKENASANPVGYLTTKDSFVEFDFVTTYNIYKNLTAGVELAYVIEDFDGKYRDGAKFDDGWHAALQFQYKF